MKLQRQICHKKISTGPNVPSGIFISIFDSTLYQIPNPGCIWCVEHRCTWHAVYSLCCKSLTTSKSLKMQHIVQCGEQKKKWIKRLKTLSSAPLMCNMEPFFHFLCVSVDMKVAWWLLPFYCISPRVIAVSSLLLKPCQSAWAKWQPSGNWITEKRGSQESPSSDLLAKWPDCVVMSWALRWPFPWQSLKTHIKKFLQVSDAKSIQWALCILVPCHHRNTGLFSKL